MKFSKRVKNIKDENDNYKQITKIHYCKITSMGMFFCEIVIAIIVRGGVVTVLVKRSMRVYKKEIRNLRDLYRQQVKSIYEQQKP